MVINFIIKHSVKSYVAINHVHCACFNLDIGTAAANGIDQTTETMASIDDETSDENDNDPLNLSHTKVSRVVEQETAIESTTPMDIGIM